MADQPDTISNAEWNRLEREARRHSCDTVGELITAPGPRGTGYGDDMPAEKAGTN